VQELDATETLQDADPTAPVLDPGGQTEQDAAPLAEL
jgi:hypothetical protein